jgi:hypothetical protein
MMPSLRELKARLPWWCRKILVLAVSYYGWKVAGTGGESKSASYCYSVWQRHLTMARQNGLQEVPHTVVELGPGDSLGVGLAALLSGAKHYYAFDTIKHTDLQYTFRILE